MTSLSSCSFLAPPLLALLLVIRVAGADERCGNGWLEYADLHERIITGKDAQRYVYFRPDRWRGYSNQLLGISSMFALALVTDRAFMIESSHFTRMFYSTHIRWNASLSHDTKIRYVDDMKDCDANAALVWSTSSYPLLSPPLPFLSFLSCPLFFIAIKFHLS